MNIANGFLLRVLLLAWQRRWAKLRLELNICFRCFRKISNGKGAALLKLVEEHIASARVNSNNANLYHVSLLLHDFLCETH